MQARRAIAPVLVLASYAYLMCAPQLPAPRSPIDDDMPQASYTLATPDAPKSIEELRSRIGAILERDHLPGVAIALVGRDGPIWVGGVGVRNRKTGAPMERDTAFRVGSLSKSIIALGVMRLADQGKLDVDRPLRELLPYARIVNPWEDVAPVTLAQCLEHTAGFDDIRFNEIFTDDEQIPVLDTLALNPRSRIVRWRPGTRHGYSNIGYTLAARAIEVASGEPFDVYIRREILAPMGIVDADFARTGTLGARLATGYMDDDTPAPFHPFAHRPSAGLLASADDLAKLVHFWITRGEGYPPIVSAAGLARIERSGTLPYPHLDNDYGFANYGDVQHPVFARGHDGGSPGFHSSFRYFRDLGVGYVMLLNSNYAFRGYFEIRSLLYSYLTQGRAVPPPALGTASDRPGADFFALGNPRNELFGYLDRAMLGWRITDLGDILRVDELGGMSFDLVPTADGGYRERRQCGSSVRFLTNRDGEPIMLMSFLYAEGRPWWPARLLYAAVSLTLLLLGIAPLWASCVLAYCVIRRRRVLPLSLILWPAIAGLSCSAMPHLLFAAFHRAVIGIVHPLTIAFCGLTILFAVASTATLVQSIRWSLRPDRPRLRWRLFPLACGLAFVALTFWLAANGWIGLRTWAW
ncbi:MAG TPA: serine hydrolase domain-containing protein [Kofleriaceae bacterium]|nr:serine hydrolase domain-containing protein [Kofleriaceae bacterium]